MLRRRQAGAMQINCTKCARPIALADAIESSAGRLSHLDCARAQGLTPEERALLFVYCSGHGVAKCAACGLQFPMMKLGADPLMAARTCVHDAERTLPRVCARIFLVAACSPTRYGTERGRYGTRRR